MEMRLQEEIDHYFPVFSIEAPSPAEYVSCDAEDGDFDLTPGNANLI